MAAGSGRAVVLVGLAALALGAGAGPAPAQPAAPGAAYSQPQKLCDIDDVRLSEVSGLAASRRHPGLYYAHNDSGGEPCVYVLDRRGAVRVTLRLSGASNVDWEDIAVAPGAQPQSWDVCVADIGDNQAARREVVIYRFPEPELRDGPLEFLDVAARACRCTYEAGPSDAEGFAVHPQTGDGFIFTKRLDGACDVYRLPAPWPGAGLARLRRVAALRLPEDVLPIGRLVTAADIAPDGKRLATRSYLGGWEWRLSEAEQGDFLSIFRQKPVALRLAAEPQGEALCYAADGRALLTISEQRPTALYEVGLPEAGQHGP